MSAKLAAALVAAQKEMPAVARDSVNPHFGSRFTSLDHLIAETRPVLTRHGLAIVQLPDCLGGLPGLKTILVHESGESLEASVPLVLAKQDMQGLGAALTYARRYGWASALGISDEDDDDGNSASVVERAKGAIKDSVAPGSMSGGGTGGGGASTDGPENPQGAAAPTTSKVVVGDGAFKSPALDAIGNGFGYAGEIDASPGGKKYVGMAVRDLKPGQLRWFAGQWKPDDGEFWQPRNDAQKLLRRAAEAYLLDKNATLQLANPEDDEAFAGDADIPFDRTIDGLGN